MKLNKKTVETMCEGAGLKPLARVAHKGRDIFVCDGFAANAERKFKKFGADRNEFPFGAYCTIWWLAKGDDHFEVGHPALYKAFHNPELDKKSKQMARLNRAMSDATHFIEKLDAVASEGVPLA